MLGIEVGDRGATGGQVQLGAGLVGHVLFVGEFERAVQGGQVKAAASFVRLERGFGDLFRDKATGGAFEAIGH
ncbi:hypothetical protein D9M71_823840 [compost metagenome]